MRVILIFCLHEYLGFSPPTFFWGLLYYIIFFEFLMDSPISLHVFLSQVRVPKEETTMVSDLRYGWKKLRKLSTDVSDNLTRLQVWQRGAGNCHLQAARPPLLLQHKCLARKSEPERGLQLAGSLPSPVLLHQNLAGSSVPQIPEGKCLSLCSRA